MKDPKKFKKVVSDFYTSIATGEVSASDPQAVSASLYGDSRLSGVLAQADMGLGCGDPLELSKPQRGDRMLDLGCGKGVDLYRALPLLGDEGYALGIDNNAAMLEGALKLAKKVGAPNLEFRLGDLEDLPLQSGWATLVASNCVINLTTDKRAVYREIKRVLAPEGRVAISDITLTRPHDAAIIEDSRYWGT